MTCMNHAVALRGLGENQAADAIYDRVIDDLTRLGHRLGGEDLPHALALIYLNKGNAVREQGDNRAAVVLYDKAIVIREQLAHHEGRSEQGVPLAALYANKGECGQGTRGHANGTGLLRPGRRHPRATRPGGWAVRAGG